VNGATRETGVLDPSLAGGVSVGHWWAAGCRTLHIDGRPVCLDPLHSVRYDRSAKSVSCDHYAQGVQAAGMIQAACPSPTHLAAGTLAFKRLSFTIDGGKIV